MKRIPALIGGAALALASFVPIEHVAAQELPADTSAVGSKAVVESDTGSYIVVMKADPLAASIPQDLLTTPAANAQGDALDSSHQAVLAEAGVSVNSKVQDFRNALNGFSAVLSYNDAVRLAANPKVSRVLPDELRHVARDPEETKGVGQTTDDLGNFLGLTARGEAWKSGLTGEGVVVGVIDTGIWPEHPSFADDGTFPPHAPLDAKVGNPCNFGNTAANPNDAPFDCNNKLIGARDMTTTYRIVVPTEPDEFLSARDDEGHGTHTASTAAGDANVQPVVFGRTYPKISGIAPRARIIAYKALGNLGGFTSDLAGAIDQAVADGVDVINYSIGGGPSLLSGDALSFLMAADAGVFVAVSAGNSGPGPDTIGGPADVPWVTAVGANSQRRFFQGEIKLDNGEEIKGASLTPGTDKLPLVDAQFAGKSDLCLAGTLDPAKVTGKIVLCRRGGNGRVAKSEEVFRAGGKGMILYNASDQDNLFSDNHWVPSVHIDLTEGLQIKSYIASSSRPRAQIKTEKVGSIDYAPSMTIFSSRGPNTTAPDIIKPDITAPGLQIMAGASPFTDAGFVPGELFQAIAGTSMSSPVTAGIYALLKQAHPLWSAAEAKSALMSTANTHVLDNDRTSQAGPFAMGAGMVNPGKVARRGSPFNPGLVYDAGIVDYLGFLCDGQDPFNDGGLTCADFAAGGIPTTAENLNYPSIGIDQLAGIETIRRTVTSVADATVKFTADVTAPDGYSVSVSPSTITLAPGASATYEVTFTNVSAPIGEWRFGDLTWKGSGYHVRSPIAVKGVALSAPAEVTGTGVAGTTSFDVKFGYTGPYTALPHGLVAPTPTPGVVFQDPDQTYPSTDDGAGVVALPFAVAGAAIARWSLVDTTTANDLDLYLLDGNGDVVAQSTNGGTDETIDLQLPPDGNYTLIVHGWAVGEAGGFNFNVQSWMVPLASGGTLAVDSPPTSAVIGTTGTINLSWAGLTAGTTYLGAVSHNDATSIIGLTEVTVNT